MISRATRPGSIRSSSRTPSPSSSGAIEMVNSSTRPASRNCLIVSAPPPILTSRPAAALRACCKADSTPSLTKWKTVPPGRDQGSRTCEVRTKTGVWNGASSGQNCSPPSNMRLPRIVAPGAGVRLLEKLVVRSRLTAVAEVQVLAEGLLLECPLLQPHPAGQPVLLRGVVGMLELHAVGGDIAVEGHVDAEE